MGIDELPLSGQRVLMDGSFMVSTLGSPWAQQQELVPGNPATGPRYYRKVHKPATNERTNEQTNITRHDCLRVKTCFTCTM